jgi:hypothetical protein
MNAHGCGPVNLEVLEEYGQSGFLLGKVGGVSFLKFFDPTGGINKFLFTGEKRVTSRTDFHVEFRIDGTDLYLVTTGALGHNHMIFGMYIAFHNLLFLQMSSCLSSDHYIRTKHECFNIMNQSEISTKILL